MGDHNARQMVVVTGASTGIGRAIALCLGREGYAVLAGVRNSQAAESLRAENVPTLEPLLLDVTDPSSIAEAFQRVRERSDGGDRLHAVVNNAAVCVCGPLESLSAADLQEQFGVNLFGSIAVTQAALPLLLAAKGRIINIGSNVGRVPSPFLGPYAATKAALEALCDAWRRELAPFGVQVSLVVPGPVMTPVWDKIDSSSKARMEQASPGVQRRYRATLHKFLRMNQQTAVRSRLTAEDVGQSVARCLSDPSPSHRYELGPEARLATVLSRAVPTSWIDRLIHEAIRPRGSEAAGAWPLGGLERMYYYFNHASSNNVVAVCELDGLLDPAALERALARTTARYPLLRHCVDAGKNGTKPRFVPRTEDSGLLRVEALPLLDVGALTAREMNLPINPHTALVRVVYARDGQRSALVVSLLHIISDAKSAMLVLRDIVQGVASGDEVLPAIESSADPRPARLPARFGGLQGIPRIARDQLAQAFQQLRERPARLAPEAVVPWAERRNGYVHRMLDGSAVAAIRQACRDQDVTVHGLLTAALAIALADELGLRGAARAALNIGSPVNLREAFEPPVGDALGSHVCTLGLHLDVASDQTCWSIAREVNRQLDERNARAEGMAALALVEHVSPTSLTGSARFLRLIEQRGPGNVCISNLGEVDFPERVLDVRVRAAHWTAPLSVTGYFLCAVCTTSRGLSLDFSYLEDLVSEARAQRIIARMLAVIAEATAPVEARAHDRRVADRGLINGEVSG